MTAAARTRGTLASRASIHTDTHSRARSQSASTCSSALSSRSSLASASRSSSSSPCELGSGLGLGLGLALALGRELGLGSLGLVPTCVVTRGSPRTPRAHRRTQPCDQVHPVGGPGHRDLLPPAGLHWRPEVRGRVGSTPHCLRLTNKLRAEVRGSGRGPAALSQSVSHYQTPNRGAYGPHILYTLGPL